MAFTDLTAFLIVAIAAIFLAAGFLKGIIGLGLPTLAMALLGLLIPPAHAASILVAPALVTNFWQLAAGPALRILVQRLWLMMAGIGFGTWLGSGFLVAGSIEHARLAIAGVLLLYGCMGLFAFRLRVPRSMEPWLSPLVGVATGLLTGATGIFVIPAVPYLQALRLNKDELVQALALSPTISALALGISLADKGAIDVSIAAASLLAVAPALAGMYAGRWLRDAVPAEAFQRIFFGSLIVLAVYLAWKSLG